MLEALKSIKHDVIVDILKRGYEQDDNYDLPIK